MSGLSTDAPILGIETSCDETAAAVVVRGTEIRSSVVSSQIDLHARWGGVVPEIASRAHTERLVPVVSQALEEADVKPSELGAVAVTIGPGLAGALLVGVASAKALALAWGLPFIGINHMEAHLYAAFLEEPDLEPPLAVLLVSGGHTMLVAFEGHGEYRILGSTIDDAAGEAYDKVARHLGLGYPGGPLIDKLASDGDPRAVEFPRAMKNEGYDFSFSGLKTAVINHTRKHPDFLPADIAASFQEAVVDVLVHKSRKAAADIGAKGLCIGGGVAANSALRSRIAEACEADGIRCFIPSRAMCTDNAAMVASTAWWRLQSDGPTSLDAPAQPALRL